MRRALAPTAVVLFFAAASAAAANRWAIELKGGAKLCSQSEPVVKGALYLFHRCPDGTFVSLSSSEVFRVRKEQVPDKPSSAASATVLKRDLEGPSREPDPEPEPSAPRDIGYGYDYGYYAWGWGGFCCNPPGPPNPPSPGPPPPAMVRPNGFPMVGPPGFYNPPPTGPNGFPNLFPQPPVVSPR
jgi:hypothetical protein